MNSRHWNQFNFSIALLFLFSFCISASAQPVPIPKNDSSIGSPESNPLHPSRLEYVQSHIKMDSKGWTKGHKTIYLFKGNESSVLRATPDISKIGLRGMGSPFPGLHYFENYIWIIQIRGDWVKVLVPLAIQTVPGTIEHESTYSLNIQWDRQHPGWIQWRVPGITPGSQQILIEQLEFGAYD